LISPLVKLNRVIGPDTPKRVLGFAVRNVRDLRESGIYRFGDGDIAFRGDCHRQSLPQDLR